MAASFGVLVALSVHLTKAPPNAKGAKVLGIRAHLYIERAAMTDRNAAPITAVSVGQQQIHLLSCRRRDRE